MRYSLSLLACSLVLCIAACDGEKSAGGTPAPPAQPTGESCSDALAVAAGAWSGDSTGMANDITLPCDYSSDPAGADVVYELSLAQESGVVITAGGFDLILALTDASCAPVNGGGACADSTTDTEELRIPALAAGDYFIVVDSYGDGNPAVGGAPFTLTVEVTGPFCQPDGDEPNDVLDSTATPLGLADITVDDDNLCAADTDIFILGHLGGSFAANITGNGVSGTLLEAVVSADGLTASPGATLGSLPYDGGAARGVYFIQVTGSGVPNAGAPYALAVTHLCGGDKADRPLPQDDDEQLEHASFISGPIDGGLARTICAEDVDAFLVFAPLDGDVVLTLADAAGGPAIPVALDVYRVNGTLSERPTVASSPLTAGTDYTVDSLTDLVVTIPAIYGDRFLVVASNATGAVDYVLNAALPAMSPPSNDLCSNAYPIADLPIRARTIMATHDISGSCNGEEDVPVDSAVGPASDVFYTLHLSQTTDVQLELDGRESRFFASLYLFELPGGVCPTDLTTLAPVIDAATAAPLCQTGSNIRLRAPQLPAGDYLVVVDGNYFPEVALFGLEEEKTAGTFLLTPTLSTSGFPPPTTCASTSVRSIPTAGAPVTMQLNNTFEHNDLTDWGDCSSGGSGNEIAFRLEPTADVSVTITTTGIDTILSVLAASCPGGTSIACNDDIDADVGNFGSSVTASLTGGTVYYVVIDGWNDSAYGPIDVTIELAN